MVREEEKSSLIRKWSLKEGGGQLENIKSLTIFVIFKILVRREEVMVTSKIYPWAIFLSDRDVLFENHRAVVPFR